MPGIPMIDLKNNLLFGVNLLCIMLLSSWFEAKDDLILKHLLGRHCVLAFFLKVTSHPILTLAKEGNLSLRRRRR